MACRTPVEEALAIVDELAPDDFAALPYDYVWLFAMNYLVDTVAVCGHAGHAEALHRLLAPYEAQLTHGFIGGSSCGPSCLPALSDPAPADEPDDAQDDERDDREDGA